jgi:hypothetical protein
LRVFGIRKAFDATKTIHTVDLRIVFRGTDKRFGGSGINTNIGVS